jgi:hypothetical protein
MATKGNSMSEVEKPPLTKKDTSLSEVGSEKTRVEEPVLAYDKRSW